VTVLKRTRLIGVARRIRDLVSPRVRRQNRRMFAFYRQFIRPGDLVFDVGANVGNRTATFLQLGARVVAVEPQEACARELMRRFGRDPRFSLVTNALAASEGEGELLIADESTVSSMATDWIDRVKGTGRFGDIDWRGTQKVRTTTLDALIDAHGVPAFCKIDVEGFEATVLHGLSRRIAGMSFEFTAEFAESAARCVEHLVSIGLDHFNLSFGESMALALPEWVGAEEILQRVRNAPADAFGDIYAR
jgi:FkbM family methyltransferase